MKTTKTFHTVERLYQVGPIGEPKTWIPLDLRAEYTEEYARERAAAMKPDRFTEAYRVVRVTVTEEREVI